MPGGEAGHGNEEFQIQGAGLRAGKDEGSMDWVLGPWSWEGGSAHGGGLCSQAGSSFTILCEPVEGFFLIVLFEL